MTDLQDLVRRRSGADWCLFLDRDGVLNRRVVDGYVRAWEDFAFLPGAIDGVLRLAAWAPHLVVVTNQQGVAKGVMSAADLGAVHAGMVDVLRSAGVFLDAVLTCPHLATSGCPCRKPRPGLALGWLDAHPSCDASLSVMVGDSASDIEMARRLGARTGGCTALGIGPVTGADVTYRSLAELGDELSTHLEGASR